MTKFITYFSVGTASFALVYAFDENIYLSLIIAIACILLTCLGFKIENFIKTSGSDFINKLVYCVTRSDKKYNIYHKRSTYTYLGNNTYTFTKKYEIIPTASDLDRINDRFAWSAPSAGCKISPTEDNHKINTIWQKESWTCFSIYFNEAIKKRKKYTVGSEISNLIDTTSCAVPFLSNKIDRKTWCLTLEVIFPPNLHPDKAKFEIFSPNSELDSNYEEEIAYDSVIGGFKRIIHYPRKGWRYVISWK